MFAVPAIIGQLSAMKWKAASPYFFANAARRSK
jgi:hypothetical protein